MDVAHHESDSFFLAALELAFARQPISFLGRYPVGEVLKIALKAVNTKVSPPGGEVGFGDLFYRGTRHLLIISG